jgi:ribonuclease J
VVGSCWIWLPLDGDADEVSIHPSVDGLAGGGDLLALILSHGHVDHWELAHLAGPDLPVALGAATHRILKAAARLCPDHMCLRGQSSSHLAR